jgi:hypothetical protein
MARPAFVALLLLARVAHATLSLEVTADSEIRGETSVRVTAANVGDEPAQDLVAEASFLGTTVHGDPLDALPLRFSHVWNFTLPRPPGPGSFPLVVRLRYSDAFGHVTSAPVVHVVRTPGMALSPLEVTIEMGPLAATAEGRVRIVNPEPVALDGTLGVVGGADLAIAPSAQAVTVPGRGTLDVPLHVENHGALAGSTVPLYAYLTVPRGDHQDSAVGTAGVAIVDAAPTRLASPIVIVPALAVAVVVLLALAWWRVTRPGRGRPRADRRRGSG